MRSPFPGMDPFLEQPAYWSDFHATFVNYWREAIADVLPPHYEAALGERVYLVERDPDGRKLGYPDVAVTHDETPSAVRPPSSGAMATVEPVTIPLTILESPRETYIEILHRVVKRSTGPTGGSSRVLRGGGWDSAPIRCRSPSAAAPR